MDPEPAPPSSAPPEGSTPPTSPANTCAEASPPAAVTSSAPKPCPTTTADNPSTSNQVSTEPASQKKPKKERGFKAQRTKVTNVKLGDHGFGAARDQHNHINNHLVFSLDALVNAAAAGIASGAAPSTATPQPSPVGAGRRSDPPSSEALQVDAVLGFIASRADDLSINEFTTLAEVLLPREAPKPPPSQLGKEEEKLRLPPSALELWRMDRAAAFDQAGLALNETDGGRTVVRFVSSEAKAALRSRHSARLPIVGADAAKCLLEPEYLFHPSDRIRRFVGELAIGEVLSDPVSTGRDLRQKILRALSGTAPKELRAAALLLDMLWTKDALQAELRELLLTLIRRSAALGLQEIASICRQISFAQRAELIFDALALAEENTPEDHVPAPATISLFRFVHVCCWDLSRPEVQPWQRASLRRIVECPGNRLLRQAFSAGALGHLFEPLGATHSFAAALPPLVGDHASWILSHVHVTLNGRVQAAWAFLEHDPIENWAIALAADALYRDDAGAPMDTWLQWSDLVLAEQGFTWLLEKSGVAPASLTVGLLILAEWHHRLKRAGATEKLVSFAELVRQALTPLEKTAVLREVRDIYSEFQRQILALQRAPELTFAIGETIPLEELTRHERQRLIEPLVERRATLQEFVALVRTTLSATPYRSAVSRSCTSTT